MLLAGWVQLGTDTPADFAAERLAHALKCLTGDQDALVYQ